MASLCRPALLAGSRSTAFRSRRITFRDLKPSSSSSPFSSSTRVSTPRIALPRLGTLESLFPLHSIVAAARLKSRIAADTSCWSWLSQDFAVPRWHGRRPFFSAFHADAIDKGIRSHQSILLCHNSVELNRHLWSFIE